MKSYAQLAFNSRCKDMTDFIKVVVQKTHKICAKNAFLIFLILLPKKNFISVLPLLSVKILPNASLAFILSPFFTYTSVRL